MVYIGCVRSLIPIIAVLLFSANAAAQKTVSFPTEDGGVIYADVYGEGDRGVVLVHGGQFNKESWAKQAQVLVAAKFRVLALDLRGYGKSRGPGDSAPDGCAASLGCPGGCSLSAKERSEERVDRWRQHGRKCRRRRIDRFAPGRD